MSDRRTSYYLDKRNGKVKGVLAGVADYFDVDVLWVRLGFMMTLFFLFPPIFFAYWIVAWTASPKPYSLYAETPDERDANESKHTARYIGRRLIHWARRASSSVCLWCG